MRRQDVLAVILGGGRGSRLYPLTRLRTKPAVPLAGRYRLIDIPISNCISSGVTSIFVLTQFLSASLHRHVYETYKFDIFSKGYVEILPAEQTLTSSQWYQGTADAVRRQLHRILSREPKDVLILAGDHLYRADYADFLKVHRESGADISVGVLPVPASDTSRFGILRTDEDGIITAFREKPDSPEELEGMASDPDSDRPYMGSMGIYLFKTSVLSQLLSEMPAEDFGRHIIPAVIDRLKVMSWRFDGYWEDIGTISSFYEANMALTRPDRPFTFYDPHHPIYTRPRFLPASQVDNCTLQHVVLGDGCQLYDSMLRDCVVGQRGIVRPGCNLSEVVILGADDYEDEEDKLENSRLHRPHMGIGPDATVHRAIIDKNARIGKGVRISSQRGKPDRDGEGFFVRDGILVVPKHGTIPDGTVI